MADGEGLRERAAQAEADERGALDFVRIQQPDEILHQQINRIVARARTRAAVATQVVAQDIEARLEHRHLPVPHRQVIGNAGDERHPARAVAFDPIAGADQG